MLNVLQFKPVIRGLLAGSVISLVAGCGNLVVVDANPEPRESYFDGDFSFAARSGKMKTIIVGQPFAGNDAEIAKKIRAYMRSNVDGPDVEFVADGKGQTDNRYYVVVAFNIPNRTTNFDLCEKRARTPTRQTAGRITVNMAFCIDGDLKSGISGSGPAVTSADAPAFKELIVQTTRSLIPPQDGLDQGEGSNINP